MIVNLFEIEMNFGRLFVLVKGFINWTVVMEYLYDLAINLKLMNCMCFDSLPFSSPTMLYQASTVWP